MPSLLDDWNRYELEDAHPDYWQPAPRDPRPWQEIEAEHAAFRAESERRLKHLREESTAQNTKPKQR